MNREQCIDILYKEITTALPITKKEYKDSLIGWNVQEMYIEGKHAGVCMERGGEIHAVIDPNVARRHTRQLLKKYLYNVITYYGFVTTISFKDEKSLKFLKRLGFEITDSDNLFFYHKLTKIKFSKEISCHLLQQPSVQLPLEPQLLLK